MISVLIVEDEELIAEAHRSYLARLEGFSVHTVAHTARDAMRAAGEAAADGHAIDLVLLDLGLPDASGIARSGPLYPKSIHHPASPTKSQDHGNGT